MAQTINTNVLSLTAQRNLNSSQSALTQSIQRLSSGLRINSAKDDAAGLAISERFTSQIRGLNQAQRNANDGISFAQTAEGSLGTISDSLQRARELAVQAANDTNSAADRQSLNNEVSQILSEVNRVAQATEFNGQKILNGSAGALTFQVGANQGQTITVTGVDARGSQLGAATSTGVTISQTVLSQAQTDGDVLTIAGQDVAVSGDISTTIDNINEVAGDTGVTASRASSTSTALAYTADSDDARVLTINNVDLSVAAGTTADDLAEAINAISNQTGVSASNSGGTITFSNTDGADISLAQNLDPDAATGTPNDLFADLRVGGSAGDASSDTFLAGIVLASDVGTDPTLSSTGALADIGLTNGSFTNDVLSDVNVLTRENASDALQTVDFALAQVNGLRAELGAVQSRFENTITNLATSAENLSAARSRILDADFAAETAALTRAQILQQAGISALAQANAAPQSVLSLLG